MTRKRAIDVFLAFLPAKKQRELAECKTLASKRLRGHCSPVRGDSYAAVF